VTAPALLAWPRERAAADCLEAALAVLLAAASQALMGAHVPPALRELLDEGRADFPLMTQPRRWGGDVERLVARLRARVLARAADEPRN
jgi:hypothetical protein